MLLSGKSSPARPFGFRLQLESKKTEENNDFSDFAVLEIYDFITDTKVDDYWYDDGGVPIADVTAKLDEAAGKPLLVRINSGGGIAHAGITMFNRLREHDAEVVTLCDGLAGSAASVIFMAGDRRFMAHGSNLMVHEPATFVYGNRAELRKAVAQLDALTSSVVSLYMDRSGAKKEDVEAWLAAETFFDPQGAIDAGFATALWTPQRGDKSATEMKTAALKTASTAVRQAVEANQPKLSRSAIQARAERIRRGAA